MLDPAMGRSLALACVLGGCSFSTSIDPGAQPGIDSPPGGDAPPADAPPDVPIGNEMPVQAMSSVTSSADIYLRTTVAPNENTNGVDFFVVDGDNIATGLVRFDLSAIPVTAVVTTAEITLYCDTDPGQAVSVYQMLESWDEATATSNQRSTGVAWLGAGATPPSRGTTAIGTFTPGVANQTYTFAITTATAQTWVAMPAMNFGVAIATTNANGPRFGTREKGTASQRPSLRVVYSN
jgi:hypothetical protein